MIPLFHQFHHLKTDDNIIQYIIVYCGGIGGKVDNMRKLQWLDTKKKSLKQIQKYLEEKYGMEICIDENVSWMDKAMEMSGQIFKDVKEEIEDIVKDNVLNVVLDNVLYPDNYREDIQIGVYMYLSYMMQFGDKAIISIADFGNFEEESSKRKKWRKEAKDNFPICIEDGMGGWIGISWCKEYQEILFTTNNIDLFDFEKPTDNITRYGFKKAKDILDELKETNIENRIFFDMTMGVSLTGTIYQHIKTVTEIQDFEVFNKIIKTLGSLECLCLRNIIATSIFERIQRFAFSDEYIKKCSLVLEKLSPAMNEYYNDILYLIWWNIVHEKSFSSEKYLQSERETIEFIWESYYSIDVLYEEWLKQQSIYRFKYNDHQDTTAFDMIRNIENYAKCINDVDLMEKNGNIKRLLELMRNGYLRKRIEEDGKPIGENIIECENGYLVGKTIKKKKLPDEQIINPKTKVNKITLYALIHRKVVSSCLQKYKKEKL